MADKGDSLSDIVKKLTNGLNGMVERVKSWEFKSNAIGQEYVNEMEKYRQLVLELYAEISKRDPNADQVIKWMDKSEGKVGAPKATYAAKAATPPTRKEVFVTVAMKDSFSRKTVTVPGIGVASQSPEGTVKLAFMDGSAISILSDSKIEYSSKRGVTHRYSKDDTLPEQAVEKLKHIPEAVEKLRERSLTIM